MNSFYLSDGDVFVSTPWTVGPWDPGAQHAGPPAALTARSIERLADPDAWHVARFTFEILRAIPVAPLRVEARISRPGRSVQFAEASVRAGEVEVARGSAWLVRVAPEPGPATTEEPPPFVGPEESERLPMPDLGAQSYFAAMEWRAAKGSFLDTGPATVWMRMNVNLVDDEQPSPLTRVLAAADSGNGISRELDFGFLFINTELTVHLQRMPEGEWVCLDAVTRMDSGGVGIASSVLYDQRSRIGTGAQALLIGTR
jgi:hypothetical protein